MSAFSTVNRPAGLPIGIRFTAGSGGDALASHQILCGETCMTSTASTGFVCHELYMWHNTGNYAGIMPYGYPVQPYEHAENPETKRRFRNLLEVSGLLKQLLVIEPRVASDEEILRFHTRAHFDKVRELSAGIGGDAGQFTPLGRGSFEIAMLSAGGVLAALEAVLEGRVRNAYALVRPPGHHALADMGILSLGRP